MRYAGRTTRLTALAYIVSRPWIVSLASYFRQSRGNEKVGQGPRLFQLARGACSCVVQVGEHALVLTHAWRSVAVATKVAISRN